MTTQEIRVPDIGDFKDVRVVELLVNVGDYVAVEAPLVVLETDKATLEVPSSHAGVVRKLCVVVGDLVSQESLIAVIEVSERVAEPAGSLQPSQTTAKPEGVPSERKTEAPPREQTANLETGAELAGERKSELPAGEPPRLPTRAEATGEPGAKAAPAGSTSTPAATAEAAPFSVAHRPVRASPALRRYARSLGIDLTQLSLDEPAARVTREDVERYVRNELLWSRSNKHQSSSQVSLPSSAGPEIDHAKFGPIELCPLPRIRRLAGANLVRNWVTIPHVTNFDEADVTALDAFRAELNAERGRTQKVTLLPFLLKACAGALRNFPELRSTLRGDSLIVKNYFHIGFAADTKDGLVVPIIRDVDRKSVSELAVEAADLATAARAGKLRPLDMQGGCFSISSLGGIGGTHFTPIINAPEVAILGAGRISERLALDGDRVHTRKILPMSMSWDHRALDGALAARFLVQLTALLTDVRRMLL